MAEKDFKHLVRIANTDLDGNRRINYSLTRIKGISFMFSNAVLSVANIDLTKRTGDLTDQEIKQIDDIIKNPLKYKIPSWLFNRKKDVETGNDLHLIGGDLDFHKENDIKIMKKIKSYKGVRHIYGLPVRGQKTKSNFRKNKGKVTGVKKRKGAKSGRT